jgi:aconitate hydratase
MANSFGTLSTLKVGNKEYEIHRLSALKKAGLDPDRLPFSLRILLENLLRTEDGRTVRAEDIRTLAAWQPKAEPADEIAFMPGRVLLQDFTGGAGHRSLGAGGRVRLAAGAVAERGD